jgi:predicted SnoaL-like aldol condensation-catalyzing enzyme
VSVETNKSLVRDFYSGDFARGVTENIADYFASDFVDHDPPGPVPPGLAGVGRVTIRFTIEGEQTGFFPGRQGKTGPMRIDVIAILRLADGKIVERWGHARVA